MTVTCETNTKPKRGRPFGIFGPKRRRERLIAEFIRALGGDAAITPVQEMNITRAVALVSIAEERRRQIAKFGASTQDLTTLIKIEECADNAVRRLKLPVTYLNTVAA